MRLFPAVLMFVLLFAVACGSRAGSGGRSFLEQQLLELERLPKPDNLDQSRWADLKSSLRVLIEERIASGRTVSGAPDSNASKAQLAFDGTDHLSWGYYNAGDYDQNSEVNVADLSALGAHLFETVPADPNSSLAVIDGDSNGEINVADLTPLGANLGNRVSAYNVYSSQNVGDYPANNTDPSAIIPIGTVQFAAATGNKTTQRLQFSFTVPSPQASDIYWVRPEDGSGDGTPSTQAEGGNGGPTEPGIKVHQVTYDLGGGNVFPYTDQGLVDVTFIGVAGLLYFNMTFNGTEVLTNIPLLSDEGIGTLTTITLPFSLDVPSGTPLSEANTSYSIDSAPKQSSSARHASTEGLTDIDETVLTSFFNDSSDGQPLPAVNNYGRDPALDGAWAKVAARVKKFPRLSTQGEYAESAESVSDSLAYLKVEFGVEIGSDFGKPFDPPTLHALFEGSEDLDKWAPKKQAYIGGVVDTTITLDVDQAAAAVENGMDVEAHYSRNEASTIATKDYPYHNRVVCGIIADDKGNFILQENRAETVGRTQAWLDRSERFPNAIKLKEVVETEPVYFVIESPIDNSIWKQKTLYGATVGGEQVSTVAKNDDTIGFSYFHSFGDQQVYYGEISLPFLLPADPENIDGQPTHSMGHHSKLTLLDNGRMACVFQDQTIGDHRLVCVVSDDESGDTWGPETVLDSDPTVFPGDNIDCELDSAGKLCVISSTRGGTLDYCQSTDDTCSAFTAMQSVPFTYSLHCECVQDSSGDICVSYEGSGSIKILDHFDFSDGSSDAETVCVTNVDDTCVECFDMICEPATGKCHMIYADANNGLYYTETTVDKKTWVPGQDVDGAATKARGGAICSYETMSSALIAAAWYSDATGAAPIHYAVIDPDNVGATVVEDIGTAYSSFGHQDALTVLYDRTTFYPWNIGPIVFAPDENAVNMKLYWKQ